MSERMSVSARDHTAGSEGHGTHGRLVRTIVCGYTRDALPASWVQVLRRFERAVARARLRIRVRLMPLEDLPERFDVLVVAPQLAEQARALAGSLDARVVVTTRERAVDAVNELLGEIAEARTMYAEPADPNEPVIVTRRGGDVL